MGGLTFVRLNRNCYNPHCNGHEKSNKEILTVTSILQFLQDAKMSQAFSYGNSLNGGPSQVMVMRQFNILLDRRFCRSVLIRERAKKPRSQSAVDIGMSRPIAASFVIFRNIHISSSDFTIFVISCLGNSCFRSLLAATTLLNTFNSDLVPSGSMTLCGP